MRNGFVVQIGETLASLQGCRSFPELLVSQNQATFIFRVWKLRRYRVTGGQCHSGGVEGVVDCLTVDCIRELD